MNGISNIKNASAIDPIADFLIELGMKPCMHLVEISVFFTK